MPKKQRGFRPPANTRLPYDTQAKRAAAVAEDILKPTKYQEWRVVAIFYSALHWVDYLMIKRNPDMLNFGSHNDRLDYLQDELKHLYGDYAYLFKLSKEARYKGAQYTCHDVNSYANTLRVFESHIKTLIESM